MLEIVILSLPKCYLEDYVSLYNQALSVNWPKQPKYIVTSNSFDTNDLFKMWIVTKRRHKSDYIVLQHGASYGTDRLSKPSIEEKTADKFITWGWSADNIKYVKGGMQIPKYIFNNANKSEKILLIQRAPLQKVRTYDVNFDYYQNFIKQEKFICDLNKNIYNKLNVRLQSDWRHHKFEDFQRWSDLIKEDSIDTGLKSMNKVYSNYGLLIFTYESSGFLQALSGNFPTICIWDNVLSFATSEVKEHYYNMMDAGIIYEDYSDLAKFLNSNDIKLWWASEKVQKIRLRFLREFCTDTSMISVIKSELT